MFKSFTSVHVEPFHNSVTTSPPGDGGAPPNAKADVVIPAPANALLALFKSLSSVQLVPFQDSVLAVSGGENPPNANAAVCVPVPLRPVLPVVILFTSVQLVPL